MKTPKPLTDDDRERNASVARLLRRYLGNGVSVTVNPTYTRLAFSHPGMGEVVVEATDDGLVIHEPTDKEPQA